MELNELVSYQTGSLKDGLYVVNGKKTLYYQNQEWFKPIYQMGRYTGNIFPLEKQPKIIKSILTIKCL